MYKWWFKRLWLLLALTWPDFGLPRARAPYGGLDFDLALTRGGVDLWRVCGGPWRRFWAEVGAEMR